MKNLVFINGTMGIGKTTISKELKKILPNCVFLDGDWCWDMDPFIVNNETKAVVEKNIQFMLNSFINCSEFRNIVFCWVMHHEAIIDNLISGLNINNVDVYKFSLVCEEEVLIHRLNNDIKNGLRNDDIVSRSIERLSGYTNMDTIRIDTSSDSPLKIAEEIQEYISK